MIISNVACPHCRFYLHQTGSSPEQLVCPNNFCPAKFDDACPHCASTHKEVRLVRVGLTAFTCLDCGQAWDAIRSKDISSGGSKVAVLRFSRKMAG